jgi:ribosomal protein L37E
VTSALASHPPLTATDRCDRCGAQAYIRATLASGGELLFCAHHGHAHETRLREMSVAFQDNSSALANAPASESER